MALVSAAAQASPPMPPLMQSGALFAPPELRPEGPGGCGSGAPVSLLVPVMLGDAAIDAANVSAPSWCVPVPPGAPGALSGNGSAAGGNTSSTPLGGNATAGGNGTAGDASTAHAPRTLWFNCSGLSAKEPTPLNFHAFTRSVLPAAARDNSTDASANLNANTTGGCSAAYAPINATAAPPGCVLGGLAMHAAGIWVVPASAFQAALIVGATVTRMPLPASPVPLTPRAVAGATNGSALAAEVVSGQPLAWWLSQPLANSTNLARLIANASAFHGVPTPPPNATVRDGLLAVPAVAAMPLAVWRVRVRLDNTVGGGGGVDAVPAGPRLPGAVTPFCLRNDTMQGCGLNVSCPFAVAEFICVTNASANASADAGAIKLQPFLAAGGEAMQRGLLIVLLEVLQLVNCAWRATVPQPPLRC